MTIYICGMELCAILASKYVEKRAVQNTGVTETRFVIRLVNGVGIFETRFHGSSNRHVPRRNLNEKLSGSGFRLYRIHSAARPGQIVTELREDADSIFQGGVTAFELQQQQAGRWPFRIRPVSSRPTGSISPPCSRRSAKSSDDFLTAECRKAEGSISQTIRADPRRCWQLRPTNPRGSDFPEGAAQIASIAACTAEASESGCRASTSGPCQCLPERAGSPVSDRCARPPDRPLTAVRCDLQYLFGQILAAAGFPQGQNPVRVPVPWRVRPPECSDRHDRARNRSPFSLFSRA